MIRNLARSTIIKHAVMITEDSHLSEGWILIEDDRIRLAGFGDLSAELENSLPTACAKDSVTVIDAHGQFVFPGFIDLHTHGAGGSDFMDGTLIAWKTVARTHARFGTTALLATTLASTSADLNKTFNVWKQWQENTADHLDETADGASILGLHLEGPYFAMNQRGAQDPRYIHPPDPDEYLPVMTRHPEVIRWTVAPELSGMETFSQHANAHGILLSMGHTDALYEDTIKAIGMGFCLVTHLYSCMSGVTRKAALRHGGLIETSLIRDDLTVEVIADGRHLPLELLELIWRCKGRDRIVLTTDSMRAAGQDVDESILGSLENGQRVIIRDQVAKLPDETAMAGSIATADRLLRTMIQVPGVSLADAVYMLTRTPARLLGLADQKGAIASGYDADLVFMDQSYQVKRTLVGGKTVYHADDA